MLYPMHACMHEMLANVMTVTNHVLASISLVNFDTRLLTDFVLSISRSCIVHNFCKRGAF